MGAEAERVAAVTPDRPHCSTCHCFAGADADTWRPYSATTIATRECSVCRRTSPTPGRDGWRWRHQAPKTLGRALGRATESICAGCARAWEIR